MWNPNEGKGQTGFDDAAEVWPGDDYVDVVGMDAYDWWPAYTSDDAVAEHRDGAYGWNHWLHFAKSKSKKLALPEWGLASGNAASGGDNPQFIDFAYTWMHNNADNLEYEAYFNEDMDYLRSDLLHQNPRSASAYRDAIQQLAATPGGGCMTIQPITPTSTSATPATSPAPSADAPVLTLTMPLPPELDEALKATDGPTVEYHGEFTVSTDGNDVRISVNDWISEPAERATQTSADDPAKAKPPNEVGASQDGGLPRNTLMRRMATGDRLGGDHEIHVDARRLSPLLIMRLERICHTDAPLPGSRLMWTFAAGSP